MENVAKTPALIGRRGPREYNDAWQEACEWARRGEGQKEGRRSEENVKDAERERERDRERKKERECESELIWSYILCVCAARNKKG